MNEVFLLLPILAHILLVISLYFVLASRKMAAVKAGGVDLQTTALNNKAWPDSVLKVSNNIDNNFEAPVLYYAVCLVSFVLGVTNTVAIVCSIAYVVLRYVHSYVHIGSNYVPLRMRLFALSLITVLVMVVNIVWVIL